MWRTLQRLLDELPELAFDHSKIPNDDLENFNAMAILPYGNVEKASSRILHEVNIGIDTLSKEEVVTSAGRCRRSQGDVAVITKNDGFTWLSRKSWYHHKDVDGMYGSMGI